MKEYSTLLRSLEHKTHSQMMLNVLPSTSHFFVEWAAGRRHTPLQSAYSKHPLGEINIRIKLFQEEIK